eukprot:1806647-Amphidinium_carterae.1
MGAGRNLSIMADISTAPIVTKHMQSGGCDGSSKLTQVASMSEPDLIFDSKQCLGTIMGLFWV